MLPHAGAGRDRVRVQDLTALHHGERRTFSLPTTRACLSGRSLAQYAQKMYGGRYATEIDADARTLTVTRYDK